MLHDQSPPSDTMLRLILTTILVTLVCARAPSFRVVTPTLDGRIVGGNDTKIEEHPYQVSVQYAQSHMCGGSLLAPNIVLTSAHCTELLENHIQHLSVRAGTALPNRGGVILPIKSIHHHPKFYPQSFEYDTAVLVLDGSFPLYESVQLISLQPVGIEVPDRKLARVTGWGVLRPGGPFPVTLQAVDLPKVSVNTCKHNYKNYNITDRMHCFGYAEGGKASCQGDSGGPAVVDGRLVGTVSWGLSCADPNFPAVYVKISDKEIHDFIQKFVVNHV